MQTPVRNVMENTCKIFSTMKYEFDFVSLTFSPTFEGRPSLYLHTSYIIKYRIRLLEYFAKVISLLPPIEIKEKNMLTFPRKTDWKFKNTKIENSLNNHHEFVYSRTLIKFSLCNIYIYPFDHYWEIFASNKVLIFQIIIKYVLENNL